MILVQIFGYELMFPSFTHHLGWNSSRKARVSQRQQLCIDHGYQTSLNCTYMNHCEIGRLPDTQDVSARVFRTNLYMLNSSIRIVWGSGSRPAPDLSGRAKLRVWPQPGTVKFR